MCQCLWPSDDRKVKRSRYEACRHFRREAIQSSVGLLTSIQAAYVQRWRAEVCAMAGGRKPSSIQKRLETLDAKPLDFSSPLCLKSRDLQNFRISWDLEPCSQHGSAAVAGRVQAPSLRNCRKSPKRNSSGPQSPTETSSLTTNPSQEQT